MEKKRSNVGREAVYERMITAATELLADDGFRGLSMRKVADRCGVPVMTLYGHVRTREALIGLVVDRFLADLPVPDVEHLSWAQQVAEVFRAVNGAFEAHPVLSEITGHQTLDSLAFYRGAEVALRALKRTGLSDRDAVGAFDALTSFVIGFSQRKAERRLRSLQSAERLSRIRSLAPDEFATIIELAGQLVTWDSERHFEDGLQLIISGIEERVASASRSRGGRDTA